MVVSKQLQFIKGSAILILSNLVIKGINFLLLPLYTKYLTPAELGISDTITGMTSIIFPLLVMGLDSAFSAFYFDEKTQEHKTRVFNTIWLTLVIASVVPIIVAFFSKYISLLLFDSEQYTVLIGIALVSVTMNLWYLPLSLLMRMENRMTIFALVNVISSLTMILLNIIFVSIFQWGVYSLILSTAIIQGIQFILYLILGKIKFKILSYDKNLIKRVLKYSLPLVPAVLATWILNMSDRYIINYFHGEWEVGLYGIAARFGTIISLFANGVYMSYTTFAYDKKGEADAKEQYSRILNAFVFLLLLICITGSVYSKEIVGIMTEASYKESYKMMAPILWSQLLYGVNTLVGYAIGFEKKSYLNLIATSTGAVINVILNIVFIPEYGALAAAYTTCFSFALMTVMTYTFAQKLYYVEYSTIKLFITITGSFAIVIIVQYFNVFLKTAVWLLMLIMVIGLYKDALKDYLLLLRRIINGFGLRREK